MNRRSGPAVVAPVVAVDRPGRTVPAAECPPPCPSPPADSSTCPATPIPRTSRTAPGFASTRPGAAPDAGSTDAGAGRRGPGDGHDGGRFAHAAGSRPLEGFTIQRAIHRGGFGEVYYATSDAGKEVALKLLRQHVQVELRGANACLNLNHPNLVTIFDIKRDARGDAWIVMEYAGGPRLADVIADRGKLSVEEIERWLRGLVAGLSFLHDRGLVHRDLKPANIFAEGGTVKVGDVGLSKFISESRGSEHTGSVGTVYYMAPEIARGRYGRGVDIYALAVMLFEMYTGELPFDGESQGEILMKHLSAPPDLSPLPPALRPVFARALHKDPDRRTRSAAELERQFRAAVRGHAAATGTDPAGADAEEPVDLDAGAFRPPPPERAPTAETGDAGRVRVAVHREPPPAPVSAPAPVRDGRANRGGDLFAEAVKWLAVAVLLVAVVSPRTLGWLGGSAWRVAIVAALGFGVYRLVKFLAGGSAAAAPAPQRRPPPPPPPRGEPAARYVPRHGDRPRRSVPLMPEDRRTLSTGRRITEFSGSATVAGLLSAAVAGVMAAAGAVGSFGEAALFGCVLAVGSWGVLGLSKIYEGRTPSQWVWRFTQLGLGGAVGLLGWQAAELLMVGVPIEPDTPFAEVTGLRGELTGASWVAFFALLFAARRWWRHADGYRPKRLRVRTALATLLVGTLAMLATGVPARLALPWAAAGSVVTQLSAVWTPRRKRPRKVPAG